VVDQPGQVGALPAASPDGLVQGVEGEVGAQVGRRPPAHDPAGEQIGDEGQVDEAGPGGDVGVHFCEQSVEHVYQLERGHQLNERVVEHYECPVRMLSQHRYHGVGQPVTSVEEGGHRRP
jgi:hypothetical protein